MGRTEFLTPTIWSEPKLESAKTTHESEMALCYECMEWCAHIVLDIADIVIALGKVWKRRNRE